MENRLGLTTVTGLLAVVTTLTLCEGRSLARLCEREIIVRILFPFCFLSSSPPPRLFPPLSFSVSLSPPPTSHNKHSFFFCLFLSSPSSIIITIILPTPSVFSVKTYCTGSPCEACASCSRRHGSRSFSSSECSPFLRLLMFWRWFCRRDNMRWVGVVGVIDCCFRIREISTHEKDGGSEEFRNCLSLWWDLLWCAVH